MITRPAYKKKELSTPPNKMKHISPLQWHVFLPLTCRISKRNYIFSIISPPFCHDWQRVQEARKLHLRNIKMIKDDQRGTRNPHKCMNVMNKDAMDDKLRETCKTCEKQCMQKDLDGSRGVKMLSSRSQPRWIDQLLSSYWADRRFLNGSRICWEAIENAIKRKSKGSIGRPAVERYREVVEIA